MTIIKREDLTRAVKALGFDPRDVEHVVIEPFRVRVTLFERSEKGQKVITVDGHALRRVEVRDVV